MCTKFEVAVSVNEQILMERFHIFESSPSLGLRRYFSGSDLMMGLDKHQLHKKVDSFSHCRTIKGEPQNFSELH